MINRSKAYVAPLVLTNIPELPFNIIKNTYIFSDFKPLEPIVYVLLAGDSEIVNSTFVEGFYRYEEVEDIFSLGKDYLIVTNLNIEYNYEYLCFKRGNYSWYTPGAKTIIINYLIENVNKRSLALVDKMRSVFSRDPMLKRYYENTLDVNLGEEAELGSRISEGEETFNSNDYEKFERIRARVKT